MIIAQAKKDYGSFDPMNWVGVVENVGDPLNMGLYKVRIIGLHSPNVEEVPVDSLPWAQAIVPTSGGNTTSIARVGEWVVGYFLDPETLQYPVIMGILPGIQSTNEINITDSGSRIGSSTYNKSSGFIPQLTQEEVDNLPKLPEGVITRSNGQPSLAPLSRGVYDNSSISVADNNLAHVCDFKKKLRYEIAVARIMTYEFVQKIRDEIKAFFTGKGPLTDAIEAAVKHIRQVLKMIKKAIDFATDVAKAIADFLKYCNQILAYIATLPYRLAKFLSNCVKEFTDAILSVFDFSGKSDDSPSAFADIKGLFKDVQAVGESTQKLVEQTTNALTQASTIQYTVNRFGKI